MFVGVRLCIRAPVPAVRGMVVSGYFMGAAPTGSLMAVMI
jgi:hypothetical protein